MRLFIKILVFLILWLIFVACPNQLVKQLDEYEKSIQDIKKGNSYITSVKPYKSFEEIQSKYNFDSLNIQLASENDSINLDNSSPFSLRISEINDAYYPDSIIVKAILYDTDGKYITGMAPPNFIGNNSYLDYWFRLQDSSLCKDAEINNYSVQEISLLESEPFSICFTLDHSGSMGKKAELLYNALKKTLYAIKPGDEIAIVNFDDKAETVVELSDDRKKYILGYNFDYKAGGTNIKPAIIHSINELKKAKSNSRKVLVLFSDGGVSLSSCDMNEIKNLIRENNVSIYPIIYGFNSKELVELANFSGGKYYQIITSKLFPFVFRDIYLSLTSYYRIVYTPPKCDNIHNVTVSFTFPELKNFKLESSITYDKSVITDRDTIGTIVFINIEFESGKAEIKNESFYEIEKIADAMLKNPQMKILINGHTDDVGSEEDNMLLSERRAKVIANELIKMGIKKDRLEIRGYGESKPLVPNTTPENRKRNRRTEFVIIEL